jgi:arginyl-tRNA---protein transferase
MKSSFDLVAAVHQAEYGSIQSHLQPAHRFEVYLEPDGFTEEKYLLFQNYQQTVHHEDSNDISRKGFERFLCGSPLERQQREINGRQQPLGSYHLCYRLDGRLIAMSVLDLLPHCVSGVYFLYHKDFERFSFGKISALREIVFALEGDYKFYYMGYYIESCIKMRYKGDYKTQHVLDLSNMDWKPLDNDLRVLMAEKKFPVELGYSQDEIRDPHDASQAVEGGMSIFELNVPGVMTADAVKTQIDLDSTIIFLRNGSLINLAVRFK